MQCQSYFPLYSLHYDLNVDNNGGVGPINGILHSTHYNNCVSSLPAAEFLRQTILTHEATFRDQVQELHRLYRRQKELMGEIKSKGPYMNNLHLGPQCSDSFSAKFGQNTLGNGGSLKNVPDRESKGKKIGRKFLDLELPAEEYIDIEEQDDDAQFPKTPNSTGLSSNMPSKAVVETDLTASSANKWLDPISQGGSPSSSSFAQIKTNLADLNEPLITIELEDRIPKGMDSGLEFSERNHDLLNRCNGKSDGASNEAHSEVHPGSPLRKPNIKVENPSLVGGLLCFNNQSVNATSRSLKNSCLESVSKDSAPSVACDPSKHVNGLSFFDLNSDVVEELEFTHSNTWSSKTFKEVDIDRKDVIPLSCEDAVSPSGSKKSRLIDINLPCNPTTEGEQPIIEDDFVGCDDKNPAQINLNLSMNDDGSPPKSSFLEKTSLEIDLEAPPSPEVEERPPPRGDSEETQPEAPLHIATPEDGNDSFEELVKNAAEAIVSIASSKPQRCPEKCASPHTGTLEWFAGLVHSISSDLVTDFRTPMFEDANMLDEFEAMTLNQTAMKEEEYWCQNNVQVESFSYSMPPIGQTRKGRTRRSKRKDFQKEVLPSLASLSRYEVTEDIQMIEGLMEAAGTPWHLSRTRRGCRVGRKPRATKPECSTFDRPVLEPKGGALIGWGKANRRPRGQRSPASPSSVLSKWLEYVI
ncbi:hypothetical protein Cgig2_017815 [Carnegiea gigantea]|uniref:Uncharacterized protein n=1 Tax=Carnegiea gigantea TaxID=171969 RepID=A0A9Q1QRF9_9CARY|nr:hypothetical protein Cgig2_017815 [Carnegiea gigantea]